MCTDGGMMSGNCVTGNEPIDNNPKKTIKSEMTADKMGRLMNMLNIFDV
jgi:hypothetical protein